MIFSDKDLAGKLERTEAAIVASIVEARARIMPEKGAEGIEGGGEYAMFDGINLPLTQTFGLEIFDELTSAEMNHLEMFFAKHVAPVFHEVSPMTDA